MERIFTARHDDSIKLHDLRRILLRHGFSKWTHGNHYIFSREDIPEIINLQPSMDGMVKPYQIQQVRNLFLKYKFHLKEN